ncbi:hypothetical protein QTP70_030392 [Hemibagrus guttatus]|uniref:phosphatidate cytidylyltransferase n=1 Tax=Hemibagrus guttatus TaxID=175788 RepID=A0AAE0Q6P7_9TELE|nr:hypothetical protein QTP70_030392 [Hemibagrus guttatus]
MTELRHRGGTTEPDLQQQQSEDKGSEVEDRMKKDGGVSDSESKPDSGVPDVPAPSDDTPEVLNKALSGLSSRWKNWWVRGNPHLGHDLLLLLHHLSWPNCADDDRVGCTDKVFSMRSSLSATACITPTTFPGSGHSAGEMLHASYLYFLLCVNYFFYGETVTDYFFTLVQREEPLRILSKYPRFISFALYLSGFCMFVLSLVKKHYRLQFYMFGWTHVTLLIVVTQSHLIIHNLFEGMICCLLRRRGRIYRWIFRHYSVRNPDHSEALPLPDPQHRSVQLRVHHGPVRRILCQRIQEGPFKIKDFANTIPGHGGIMDRFDCQYLMATFVNVYIASFIRGPNPTKVIQQLLALRPDQQLYIYNSLKAHLTERGLLGALEEAA